VRQVRGVARSGRGGATDEPRAARHAAMPAALHHARACVSFARRRRRRRRRVLRDGCGTAWEREAAARVPRTAPPPLQYDLRHHTCS
jgi:hypothetical protein